MVQLIHVECQGMISGPTYELILFKYFRDEGISKRVIMTGDNRIHVVNLPILDAYLEDGRFAPLNSDELLRAIGR